jgi:hypothetical protein
MGLGISIFLIAVGAVLTLAVDGTASGVNFDAIGIILVLVGGIGLLVSLIAATTRRTDTHQVVEHQDTHTHGSTHTH